MHSPNSADVITLAPSDSATTSCLCSPAGSSGVLILQSRPRYEAELSCHIVRPHQTLLSLSHILIALLFLPLTFFILLCLFPPTSGDSLSPTTKAELPHGTSHSHQNNSRMSCAHWILTAKLWVKCMLYAILVFSVLVVERGHYPHKV